MNLPNKLTILRMIMIPVFLVVLYIPGLGMAGNIAAAAIFILASITDFLDIRNNPLIQGLDGCAHPICLFWMAAEFFRIPKGWILSGNFHPHIPSASFF